MDDFEWATPPTSNLNGGGWTQTASGKPLAQVVSLGGGKVLLIPGGSSASGYTNLTKPAAAPEGSQATLRFRFYLPSGATGDTGIGLASVSADAAGSSLAQNMAGSIRLLGAGPVQIWGGGTTFINTDQTFAVDTWYEMALVLDTRTDTWTALVEGGAYTTATPVTQGGGTTSVFPFRGSGGATNLTHVAIRTNAAHVGNSLYLDDIHFEASNLPPIIHSEKSDGYRGIWFTLGQFSEYGDKYSGGLGTYTANHNPLAIYAPEVNKTFFVYGGTKPGQRHLLLMASYYDHAQHRVPRPTIVYDKQGVDDPHDNPAISIDAAGYIWVFVAGRNTTRDGVLLKSVEPYSVDAFQEIQVMPDMTYPQPWYDQARGGFILMFTKYTAGRELYVSTSADGLTWSAHKKIAGFGGHYQVSAYHRDSGKIGTFFNYHPGGDVNKRTNLYYAESRDFGQAWTTVAGQPLNLPLNAVQNPALVIDYQSQGILQYTCDLNWDKNGNPLILYLAPRHYAPGPDGDPREWRLTRWTGSEWVTRVICTSTHAYDMGSLYVDGDRWTVIGPTGTGPQQWGSGGEMETWTSDDQGETWKKQRAVTHNSVFNHSYARRPLAARNPFFAFWADGNPDTFSESRIYFCNSDGTRVWRLPYSMLSDWATPEEVHPPFQRWQASRFTEEELEDEAISGPDADVDEDGRKNLVEYTFGTQPKDPDTLPIATNTFTALDGSDYLSLTYRRAVDAADVMLIPEVAESLEGPWMSGPEHTVEVSRVRLDTPSGEMEEVHVRDSIAIGEGDQRFMRLQIVR